MTEPSRATFWRDGDDPGRRLFVALLGPSGAGFALEGGGHLGEVTVAYETWGELNAAADNAVLVLHALSGDSHVAGPSGPSHPTQGWWDGLVGPGAAIDTERYFVVCPNVLGGCQGTTGPSSLARDGRPYGSRFPTLTIRDQVDVEVGLADALGIEQFAAVVGGSMGGMRVLEWAVDHPSRLARAVVVSTGAAATADEIALCSLQVRAIRLDPHFKGGDYYASGAGPVGGMAIARGIGHFSYRSALEFQERFGREAQGDEDPMRGGRYAIESYLEYHGDKLGRRFDANSYIVLSEAMNRHDVGRARGGLQAALGTVEVPVTVAGVTSDRLYPLVAQEQLVELLPRSGALEVVRSPFGHDGFLLEVGQVGAIVASALRR